MLLPLQAEARVDERPRVELEELPEEGNVVGFRRVPDVDAEDDERGVHPERDGGHPVRGMHEERPLLPLDRRKPPVQRPQVGFDVA